MIKIVIPLALLASAFVVFPACSTTSASPSDPVDAAPSAPNCGRLTTLCEEGGACEGAPDCATNLCRDGVCRTVAPSDGIQNGDETDVDCGGAASPACADGKKCRVAADCQSAVCTGNICQAPSPTDKVRNGDETDVDCGGTKAPKCKTGQGCAADGDCDNVLCDTAAKKCKAPGDDDGLKNGDETGIDCGGPTTPKKCAPGGGCTATSDCAATLCDTAAKTCLDPAPNDGIRNGTETDIDCGGSAPTNAKRCVEGQLCDVDSDCTDFCSTSKRCVTGRSCKATVGNATAGIVTCGRGETTDANKVHESCCRSLPLPGAPALRLDKYEVTAGRFRQFVESVGPNIRQWVKSEIQTNTPTGQRLAEDIPVALRDLLPASATPGDPLNLVMQVGGTVMDAREPSTSQGCYGDAGSVGHNTYYWPQAVLASHFAGHGPRRFSQDVYDEKSMNCSPYWMYAAFCAWDGGRLPTLTEVKRVWTERYPWGAAYATPPLTPNGPPRAPASGISFTETVNQNNNAFYFYWYPAPGNVDDIASYIAAPGRFFRDATTANVNGESWMDLAANNFEMLKYKSGSATFCDFNVFDGETTTDQCKDGTDRGVLRATGLPMTEWLGGSWEGHPIGNPVGSTKGVHVQYGKTGFRCARAALP
jgi:hypothetical protein